MHAEQITAERVEPRIDETKAAKLLGVSRWKLQEMCRRGELPYGLLGRKRYFYATQLEAWLRSQVVQPRKARE